MSEIELFKAALGFRDPWFINSIGFDEKQKKLNISIDFKNGSKFPCPECKCLCGAYDTVQKTWRHLDFFQYETYLHARIPRVKCNDHGIRLVDVAWARPQSGFTLFFEAIIMKLVKEMPVRTVARIIKETDKRIWRVLDHYVHRAVEQQNLSMVKNIGIDETAARRGHHYITIFVDMDTRKTIFVTEGKDSSTVQRFKDFLVHHEGAVESIKNITCDMSPAFISGVEEHFPQAHVTFDKFHVIKMLNTAVDDVRKEERKHEPCLTSSRYIWLKNPGNLTLDQAETLESLSRLKLKTARAYRMKLTFQEIYTLGKMKAEAAMKAWYGWAVRSRLQPILDFARMLKRHWSGVFEWFTSNLTNAILEGLNSLVQATKAKARGYRTLSNFKTMVYLVTGKLIYLPT